MSRKNLLAIALVAVTAFCSSICAQEDSEYVQISLKDGTRLVARIIHQDEESYVVMTASGLEIEVPTASVVSIKPIRGHLEEGTYLRFDPNYSRLIYAPTGRPLRRKQGYFSDYYVFFPGLSYGVTNQVSLMAGLTVIPGVGFDEQLKYVAVRFGSRVSDDLSVSAGVLNTSLRADDDEFAAGIAFAVGTLGRPDKSVTAAVGLGYSKEGGEDYQFGQHPLIVLGGNLRLSNSVGLLSENWFITGEDVGLSEQPFGIAVRFFGERVAVDVGFILIGEVLKEGFPIPWLSFAYNFGA